jgi:hypothetical protein
MPIEFRCPCGRLLRVADSLAGRKGICPICGKLLDVPGEAAESRATGVAAPFDLESLTATATADPDHAPKFDLGATASPGVAPADVVQPTIRLSTVRDVFAATFIFGPLGGIFLIAWNYLVLRRPRAFAVTLLAGLSLAVVMALAHLRVIASNAHLAATVLTALVSWLAVPIAAVVLQGRAYKDHLARGGQQGPVWRTLGLGACGFGVWYGVFAIAGVAPEAVILPPPTQKTLQVTPVEVIDYSPELPDEEARRLGDFLQQVGLFTGHGNKSIRLTREGEGRRVWIAFRFGHADAAFLEDLRVLHRQIADHVFPGRTVELFLCDENLQIRHVIR